jgi:hypothetical protein
MRFKKRDCSLEEPNSKERAIRAAPPMSAKSTLIEARVILL